MHAINQPIRYQFSIIIKLARISTTVGGPVLLYITISRDICTQLWTKPTTHAINCRDSDLLNHSSSAHSTAGYTDFKTEGLHQNEKQSTPPDILQENWLNSHLILSLYKVINVIQFRLLYVIRVSGYCVKSTCKSLKYSQNGDHAS